MRRHAAQPRFDNTTDTTTAAAPGRRTLTSALGVVSGGAALPAPLQAKMAEAFDADFSGVRVHQDGSADAVGAHALASGDDLHFAAGRYDPSSDAGQVLIAHEFAHVVQQRSGRVGGDGLVVDAGLEREADDLGARAVRGEVVGDGRGGSVAQGKLAQPFLPAIPVAGAAAAGGGAAAAAAPAAGGGLSAIAGSIMGWAGVEANATAVSTLLSLAGAAGGAASSAGAAIAPGQSDVQKYSLTPWTSPGAAEKLELWIQAQLINQFVSRWAAQQPKPAPADPAAAPADPAAAPPDPAAAAPAGAAAAPAGAAAAPAGAAAKPTPGADPEILQACKDAATARVKVMVAEKIKPGGAVNSREFIWTDNNGTTTEPLGTVGSVVLSRVQGFQFQDTISLDPVAQADPVIASFGLHGTEIAVCGITSGQLTQGPSWRIGYGDSLSINVQGQTTITEGGEGIEIFTAWRWDGNTTYLPLHIHFNGGKLAFDEGERQNVPDANSWI